MCEKQASQHSVMYSCGSYSVCVRSRHHLITTAASSARAHLTSQSPQPCCHVGHTACAHLGEVGLDAEGSDVTLYRLLQVVPLFVDDAQIIVRLCGRQGGAIHLFKQTKALNGPPPLHPIPTALPFTPFLPPFPLPLSYRPSLHPSLTPSHSPLSYPLPPPLPPSRRKRHGSSTAQGKLLSCPALPAHAPGQSSLPHRQPANQPIRPSTQVASSSHGQPQQ